MPNSLPPRRAEQSVHCTQTRWIWFSRVEVGSTRGWPLITLEQARIFFEKAIALNPGNIEAMVGLGRVHATVLVTDDWSARLAAAETTITKVLSLAPSHASAHATLGVVQIFTRRTAQGIAECEQALALDRNLALAHAYIGLAKYFLGRSAETEPHVNEAFRLSPRDTFAHQWLVIVGLAKAQLGADAEAVSWMRRGLDANRNDSLEHFFLGAELARLGELEEARTVVQAGLALDPNFTVSRFRAHVPSDNPIFLASRERLIEGMRLAGVPEG